MPIIFVRFWIETSKSEDGLETQSLCCLPNSFFHLSFKCENEFSRQHNDFYLMPKCCLLQWFFSLAGRLYLCFGWANVIFVAYFILRGHDTQFLRFSIHASSRLFSISLTMSYLGEFSRSWIPESNIQVQKKKIIRRGLFTSSTKREIRHFHVVAVLRLAKLSKDFFGRVLSDAR